MLENAQWVIQSLWSLSTENANHWHISVNITSGSFKLVQSKDRIPRQIPLQSCLRGNGHTSQASRILQAQLLYRDVLVSSPLSIQMTPACSLCLPPGLFSFTSSQ